jgi:hypothetical protein
MGNFFYNLTMHTTLLVLAFSLVVFAALKTRHFFVDLSTFTLGDFVDAVGVTVMMAIGLTIFYCWFTWFLKYMRDRKLLVQADRQPPAHH